MCIALVAKPVKVVFINSDFDGEFMSQVNQRILRSNGFDESTPQYLSDQTYQNRLMLVYLGLALTNLANGSGWSVFDAIAHLEKIEAIVAEEFGYTS